ncbi:MAG TPA: hypothetical protein VF281_01030 [Candidatus Saccharimonadales bacterium]
MKTSDNNVSKVPGPDNQHNSQHVIKDVEGLFFFHRSPTTVFWLSFLSLNLYNVYWVYRHWRTVRDSTGEKMRPFARSIFQIFYIHALISKIVTASRNHGNSPWAGNVEWVSAAYILSLFLGNFAAKVTTKSQGEEIVYWMFVLGFTAMTAFITRAVQKTANYHNEQALGPNCDFRGSYLGKLYAGEVIVPTIGVIIFVFAVGVSLVSYSQNLYPQGSEAEISSAKVTMDGLTAQYDTCSRDLTARGETIDTTDGSAVDTYNSDLQTCEEVRLRQNQAVDEYNRLAGFKVE